MIKKFINYIRKDIWRIRAKKVSKGKSFLLRPLRVVVLAVRGFDEDNCQLRASALTFFSLMSIVPVFAMAFGIAKGFGFEKSLETMLYKQLQGHEEVVDQIIGFSTSLLENAKGGVLSGIGIVVLFWAVIKVLGNIEHAFNHIWGIKQSRRWGRKFSDYLSIMLICPVLFILSNSVKVFVVGFLHNMTSEGQLLSQVGPLILPLIKLFPVFTMWVLFSFIYIFLPNTKVRFSSGVLAGIVAGTIYHFVQLFYIVLQVGAARMGAIYGSFAALPLFLIWIQLSWLVVLFGAEISFAVQNEETYEFEPDCLEASYSFRRLLILRITAVLVKNFHQGKDALTANHLSGQLDIPIRLVNQILFELVGAGIISELSQNGRKDRVFQPARDINEMTVKNVLDALEQKGSHNIPVVESQELDKLKESLAAFDAIAKQSPQNYLLKDL